MSTRALALVLLLLTGASAAAQDVLYEADGTPILCKVVDITPQFIKFKRADNLTGPNYSVEKSRLLMAFTGNGSYVVFGEDGKDYTNAPNREAMLNDAARLEQDLILTRAGEVLAGELGTPADQLAEAESFSLTTSGESARTLSADEVIAVLHRGGHHRLVEPPTAVAAALRQLDAEVAAYVPDAPAGPAEIAPPEPKVDGQFTRVEFEEYRNKALMKTDELSSYLQTIVAGASTPDMANEAIDLAVGLFVDEEARVEVSNVQTNTKKQYKVRSYLKKLKLLGEQYDDVRITWTDISYVSELRRGVDGNYYGIVTVQQIFEGIMEGKVVYRDVTRKNVEVVLKAYEKMRDGEVEEKWDVFLANVGVVETRKI
ncbi:MAG: hypothetical protein WBA12_00685 [Catalinimonas sp.]